MRDTLVGGDHHAKRIEELDDRLDGHIRAGMWRSKEHHKLDRRELLLLGHQCVRSLKASVKYNTTTTPSSSLAARRGDEEDTGAGDEGWDGL